MAVTLYILREDGEKVMYDGPCRCPSNDVIDHMCEHITKRCQELAPCKITLRTYIYEGESTVPGQNELTYDPSIDKPDTLKMFMEHLKPHYWDHIMNIYVTDSKGVQTDFEFEEFDM